MAPEREAAKWPFGVVRWTARVWALAVSLAALAFLAEHVVWFERGSRPPFSVTAATAFHLVAVVGLLSAWRWEVPGSCAALAGVAGFMLAVGGGWRLVPIAVVMVVPAILWLVLAAFVRSHRTGTRAFP